MDVVIRGVTHELCVGNLVKYWVLSGQQYVGIILDITENPPPRDMIILSILTGGGVEVVNVNLIFRLEVVS